MNEQQLKNDWQQRGYSYGVMVDVPGQAWEDFTHPVNELVAVLAGELTVVVSGEQKRLLVGEEVFIPAKAMHSVYNSGDSEAVWAYGYERKMGS